MSGGFFGREEELRLLAAHAGERLVTLWGPGGVGKSRLARAYAARLERPVVIVDLATHDVAAALTSALGAEEDLARAAASQGVLVVADNIGVLDDAGRRAIESLPHVIATSREAIGIDGEIVIPVGPLDEAAALALFAAGASVPCDEAVARAIVDRLDRIPLAIELAAARAALLGGAELLSRLTQPLDVLSKLREMIAWSWDLLAPSDQDALSVLATFEGAFDAALVPDLDALERLRARALVQGVAVDRTGRPTFRLLRSVRDFARRGRDPTCDAAILARAESAAEAMRRGHDARADLAALDRDLAVMSDPRAAVARAAYLLAIGPATEVVRVTAPRGETDVRAQLLLARAEALLSLGRLGEALSDLAEARRSLDSVDSASARLVGADLDRREAALRKTLGDAPAAEALLVRAIATYRALGERAREGIAYDELGAVHQAAGTLRLAQARHADAIAILVDEGARRAEGRARSHLAVATHRVGDHAAAVRLHEDALAIHREVGDRRMEGAEWMHLAYVRHELGQTSASREAFANARHLLGASGARSLEAIAAALEARLEIDEADPTKATLLLGVSRQLASWPRLEATRLLVDGHLALSRGEGTNAAQAYAASLQASREILVGFEALTPAYAAFAAGAPVPPLALLSENRHLATAHAVLAGGVTDVDARALAESSEVRRALAFTGRRRALRLTEGQLVLPDGKTIDLSRRKNLRLVLARLVEGRRANPGQIVPAAALLAAGWPGERMRPEAATKRLHTAIWTLRSLGLEGILLTEPEGYRLDPSIPVEL